MRRSLPTVVLSNSLGGSAAWARITGPVAAVRVRWVGHRLHAEADLVVDRALTVWEGHEVAVEAKHQVLHAFPKLDDATVHISPDAYDGHDPHARLAHHGS